MDVFLADLVIYLTTNFQVRTNMAFTKAVVPFKGNLIGKPMLGYVTLNNFQQTFISPGKTGTPKANDNFAPVIHGIR
jgi:hypothetical protein